MVPALLEPLEPPDPPRPPAHRVSGRDDKRLLRLDWIGCRRHTQLDVDGLSSQDVHVISHDFARHDDELRSAIVALVAPEPVQFGLARMSTEVGGLRIEKREPLVAVRCPPSAETGLASEATADRYGRCRDPAEDDPEQVHLDAGAAGVTAGRRHRRVLPVPSGGLRHA